MADDRDALIERLADLQREVSKSLAAHRLPTLVQSNLTMQQLRLVVGVAVAGPASGQELAARLGVSLGTITGIVDRLVAQGLVERREDPADRRVRRVALSPAGVELVEKLLDAGASQFRQVLERLDTDTLRTFEGILHKISQAAADLAEG